MSGSRMFLSTILNYHADWNRQTGLSHSLHAWLLEGEVCEMHMQPVLHLVNHLRRAMTAVVVDHIVGKPGQLESSLSPTLTLACTLIFTSSRSYT